MTTPVSDTADLTLTVLERLPEDSPSNSISRALDLLANERRRHVLRVVRGQGEEMTLPDIADEVAVRECDRSLPDISPETVSEIYISIYHDHLPRLVDADLLAYDQERDLVWPGFGDARFDSDTQ